MQRRVSRKIVPLVWLAVQEVAASNRNDIYQHVAGNILANYLNVNRSTWIRIYADYWSELKDLVVNLDLAALVSVVDYQ